MTTYTYHDCRDHAVVAQVKLGASMAETAENVAKSFEAQGTRRFYVHNGIGVIAAFLTRDGFAHQILRDDYLQFKGKGNVARAEIGLID